MSRCEMSALARLLVMVRSVSVPRHAPFGSPVLPEVNVILFPAAAVGAIGSGMCDDTDSCMKCLFNDVAEISLPIAMWNGLSAKIASTLLA